MAMTIAMTVAMAVTMTIAVAVAHAMARASNRRTHAAAEPQPLAAARVVAEITVVPVAVKAPGTERLA